MMMPEIWVAIAAAFLMLAIVAGSLATSVVRGRWDAVAVGARVAALATLVAALVTAAIIQGQWMAADPRQALLGLIVAMLAVQLVLAWRLGAGSGGPMVDIFALALSLVSATVVQPGAPSLSCVPRALLFQVYWVLLLLGGGSVLVAGSASLMLVLRKGLVWRGREPGSPERLALYGLLTQAAILALVSLGAGLVIGAWWASRAAGMLAAGNPREEWMAVTWLVVSMSLLSWQLDGRRGRWAAGFALVASAAVLIGLLFPVDLSLAGI